MIRRDLDSERAAMDVVNAMGVGDAVDPIAVGDRVGLSSVLCASAEWCAFITDLAGDVRDGSPSGFLVRKIRRWATCG